MPVDDEITLQLLTRLADKIETDAAGEGMFAPGSHPVMQGELRFAFFFAASKNTMPLARNKPGRRRGGRRTDRI